MKLKNILSVIIFTTVTMHASQKDIWEEAESAGCQLVNLCNANFSFDNVHKNQLTTIYNVNMKKYRDLFNSWNHWNKSWIDWNRDKEKANRVEGYYKNGSYYYEEDAVKVFYSTLKYAQKINYADFAQKLKFLNSLIPIEKILGLNQYSMIADNVDKVKITQLAGISLYYPFIAKLALESNTKRQIDKEMFYYALERDPLVYAESNILGLALKTINSLEWQKKQLEEIIQEKQKYKELADKQVQRMKKIDEEIGVALYIAEDLQCMRQSRMFLNDNQLLYEELRLRAPEPKVVEWLLAHDYDPTVKTIKNRNALDAVIYNAEHDYGYWEGKIAALTKWNAARPRALCAALLAQRGARSSNKKAAFASLAKEIAVLDKSSRSSARVEKAYLVSILSILDAEGDQERLKNIYNQIAEGHVK